jgi:peptide/nickel transport system permease protein
MTDTQLPDQVSEDSATAPHQGWRVFRTNKMAMAGLVVLSLVVVAAIFGPIISPYDVLTQDVVNRLQGPSLAHPMGTDELGRDILVRVLAGGRISLLVGALAMTVALVVGVSVGSLAGFYGKWVDNALMRLVDLSLSLPDLFLLILAASLLGPSVLTMVIIIGMVRWMNVARLVRASFLSLREQEFVQAARAIGARGRHLVFRHLIPNSMGPVIVAGTLGVASAIVAEATLSFLGLGLQPPASSWGSMLRNAQSFVFSAPWYPVFPGFMIFLTVISINFIGDGLRDVLDPAGIGRVSSRLRRRQAAVLRAEDDS